MIYKWRNNNYRVDAQMVGEELCKIQEEFTAINPSQIVETAKDEKNILHDLFEWDNTKAGHNWRVWQARYMLRSITTVVIDQQEKEHTTFAFVNIRTEETKGYQSVDMVVQSDTSRAYMLEQAKREMLIFRRKYQELKELSAIFENIDQFLGITA